MRRRVTSVVSFVALSALVSVAADVIVFGPETFTRETGEPRTVTRTFKITNPSGPFTLRVVNHGVTSGVIAVNGETVLGPDDFKGKDKGKGDDDFVPVLERRVMLHTGTNQISVELRGKPGTSLTAQIVNTGTTDTTPPTITATVNPPANARGWNNSTATVSFTCADAGSGIATCPAPITVSGEGASQVVTGTATDKAGNTATTSVTLNIDKTRPIVTASQSPNANAAGWNNGSVAVTFAAADALSGVAPGSLTAPVTLSTDGSNLSASGQATDLAGNVGSVTLAGIKIDQTQPTITVTVSPAPNANGWNKSPVTARFMCADDGSGIATCPPDRVMAADGAHQPVTGTATDRAGNTTTASATISIDRTPPALTFASPANGAFVFTPTVTATGTVTDLGSGVAGVTCNSAPATVTGTIVDCDVTLTRGPNSIAAIATDLAGNSTSLTLGLNYTRVPVVRITSPDNLAYLNSSNNPTTVSGTVDDGTAQVTINSIPAPAAADGSFSIALPLAEGPNIITASALTIDGTVGTASIEVTLDTTPPRVAITSPPDQFVTTEESITVSGNVNDIVVGTVNDQQAQVTVKGVSAQVANRTFVAANVPLAPGPNDIEAVATDRVGNSRPSTTIRVTRQVLTQAQIRSVSGNNQTGAIGAVLVAPLVVALTDATGHPSPNTPVIFKVTQNDGLIAAGGALSATVMAATDAGGHAHVAWTLGNRAGAGGNLVEAYAVGFEGTAIFTATGTQGAAGKIVVDTGNDQIGAIGQALPKPFIAVVVDAGNNRLAGVPVTFTVSQGGGTFDGQQSSSAVTDSDGRVAATLTLGLQEGNANNLVTATFPTNVAFPVAFTASGRAPGDPAATTISGVVLDNSNVPIPGVTIRAVLTNVLHSNLAAVQSATAVQTDAQGQFSIAQAPVGFVKLLVDGSTAQLPGRYPSLEYDVVTVAGQINTVGQPMYLLPLNTANQLCVGPSEPGGTLKIADAPGFSLTFGYGQVTFPGGSQTGCVSVTVVHGDKIPMVPGFGQQPRFIVTIQPSGAVFSPPAPITLPNVDGLKPREVTEMYSFDHDIGSFVAIGTGIVSDDGQIIRSSPGVGVLKAGWHCGGDPNASGSVADCPVCNWCQGVSCVPDPAQEAQACTTPAGFDGICKSGTCKPVPSVKITAEAINQDEPDNSTFSGTSGPVYGGSVSTTADNLKLTAETDPSLTVTSYEWSFTGPGSFGSPGSTQVWDLGDLLAATTGVVQFKVKATFSDGQTKEATKDIEIGVRTDDIASIGWIDPDNVPLSTAGMDGGMLAFYPADGNASMSLVQKGLTLLHLGVIAAGSIIHPVVIRDMTAAERTYILNWEFKFAANYCSKGKCPPSSFGTSAELSGFQTGKRTSYKLFNRFQIKYLADAGRFKGSPTVVKQATEIGTTNDPVFDTEDVGAAGPNNVKYAVVNGDTAFLINDGTPTFLAVRSFNTLAAPLMWSNIGSRIELGSALGSNYQVFTQVYPTYWVFKNLARDKVIPQAPAPIGNFSLTPYPPGPAPYIR